MYTYDIAIIGAGPCGIACAIKATENGKKVVVIEAGSDYEKRVCAVDAGGECSNCSFCNVIAGFGGCVHYGDSAKLTYFPSGKALYNRLKVDYERIKKDACKLWNVDCERNFISQEINTDDYNFSVKSYPVCVVSSRDIKERIAYFKKEFTEKSIEYINSEMIDFEKEGRGFSVRLSKGDTVQCKRLVLAMGRQGMKWLKRNLDTKEIKYVPPTSSLGFRFEMPKKYLMEVGRKHPDFKARTEENKEKFKTFCFCAGDNGGRLKFANYGEYTLLDGHVLTDSDEESEYGNFALLRQVTLPSNSDKEYCEIIKGIIDNYIEISEGRPIYQSYMDFREMVETESNIGISTKYVKKGCVYKLFSGDLKAYCNVAEEIFRYIADINNICIEDIVRCTNVVGLELEGLWDQIITDENFMTSVENLYIGGDCGGETQGILQATMIGIKIAEAVS